MAAAVEEPAVSFENEKIRTIALSGHVGFDSLPDQLVNKCVSKGFAFNILCIGETGIGKSTLIDTLFNTRFSTMPASHELPNVTLKAHTYDLKESNVQLKLTIVDSVGFNDQIDKKDSFKPIVDYIDDQFERYLQEELKVKRVLHSYHDTRIHACLYFIAPTGHSLKSVDLITMKQLDSRVNIIPIIAKADCITKAEMQKFKQKIMSEIVDNGVKIYQFPVDDEAVSELNKVANSNLPFAVVGSLEDVKVGNKMVKARQYPWGTVQVENENHCDFVKLREMLLRTNMEDLRELTHFRHYELYRRNKLDEMGFKDGDDRSIQEVYEEKQSEHRAEMQRKENEMTQMFMARVKDKEAELKDAEKKLQSQYEIMKAQHDQEKQKLEDKKKSLEDDIKSFHSQKQIHMAHQQLMQQQQSQMMGVSKKKK